MWIINGLIVSGFKETDEEREGRKDTGIGKIGGETAEREKKWKKVEKSGKKNERKKKESEDAHKRTGELWLSFYNAIGQNKARARGLLFWLFKAPSAKQSR